VICDSEKLKEYGGIDRIWKIKEGDMLDMRSVFR
jgi:hypothetical protein